MKNSFCVVIWFEQAVIQISQVVLVAENPSVSTGRLKRHRFDPWIERSPGGGHGNPLQYSCLENPMDRGTWQAAVHRVAQSQTQLKQLSMHMCSTHMQLFVLAIRIKRKNMYK